MIPTFKGKKKAKKVRIWKMLEEFGSLNTNQIHHIYNNSTKQGVTMNELANLLSKTPTFVKVGFCDSYRSPNSIDKTASRTRSVVWANKDIEVANYLRDFNVN